MVKRGDILSYVRVYVRCLSYPFIMWEKINETKNKYYCSSV